MALSQQLKNKNAKQQIRLNSEETRGNSQFENLNLIANQQLIMSNNKTTSHQNESIQLKLKQNQVTSQNLNLQNILNLKSQQNSNLLFATSNQKINKEDDYKSFVEKRQSSVSQMDQQTSNLMQIQQRQQSILYNSEIRQKAAQTQSSSERPNKKQLFSTQNRQSSGLNAFSQYVTDLNGNGTGKDAQNSGFKTSFGSFKSIFNLKHLNNLESAMYTSYNTNNENSTQSFKQFRESSKLVSSQQPRMINLRDHFQLLRKSHLDGQIYIWGSNQDSQLGIESQSEQQSRFILDPYNLQIGGSLKIAKLVCGAGHTLILTINHQIFSWGCNLLGQLGLGDTQPRNRPTEITALKNDRVIVDIASGAGHCMILDSFGVVYSWGASADFQTGHYVEPAQEGDTKQFIISPKRLDILCQKSIQVLKISCGIKHTALINSRSELICFGSNEFGQCGDGRQLESIECGGAHTLVKSMTQEIFSFGLNDKGQLGLGIPNTIVTVPQKIKNFTSFNIVRMSCADESTCALTSNGDVFVWGRNKDNLFALGEKRLNIIEPTRVILIFLTFQFPTEQFINQQIKNISLGSKNLCLYTSKNKLYVKGNTFSSTQQRATNQSKSCADFKEIELFDDTYDIQDLICGRSLIAVIANRVQKPLEQIQLQQTNPTQDTQEDNPPSEDIEILLKKHRKRKVRQPKYEIVDSSPQNKSLEQIQNSDRKLKQSIKNSPQKNLDINGPVKPVSSDQKQFLQSLYDKYFKKDDKPQQVIEEQVSDRSTKSPSPRTDTRLLRQELEIRRRMNTEAMNRTSNRPLNKLQFEMREENKTKDDSKIEKIVERSIEQSLAQNTIDNKKEEPQKVEEKKIDKIRHQSHQRRQQEIIQKQQDHRALKTRGSMIKEENDKLEKELQDLMEQNKKYFSRERREVEEDVFVEKEPQKTLKRIGGGYVKETKKEPQQINPNPPISQMQNRNLKTRQ
ncbi:hect e3 ubiquitin ligase [Stylonychia lemnae]|uniref:Hect e3 ubiquitin ligase n=1 Tax=Stylonychia lemnae TaxID=5949 RepID=A0A078AEJ6_STYLE|nr:hect e3 ubiquitin ligase [Stylonychia lemnae]|eukprot:CDW80694.1 hect e3 ubiquitin ligase [Stylonychia lemnae]